MTPEEKEKILEALDRRESIILIHWPRGQPGKARLLGELTHHMHESEALVALTDLMASGFQALSSLKTFYFFLAKSLAIQLNLAGQATDCWDERRSPTTNFERYLERSVLSQVRTHLVWIVDEVDVLLSTPFGNEVMGLFRSWHNRRTLDVTGPWSRLTLVLCFSSEADLWIRDVAKAW